MFESPLLQQMMAETLHAAILELVKDRFGTVPRDVAKHLRAILDQKKLQRLNLLAAKCSDIDTFRKALL